MSSAESFLDQQAVTQQPDVTRPFDAFVRLLLIAAAVGIATLGYRDLAIDYPWWHALGELATGSGLLALSLRDAAPIREPPLRRWARRASLILCVVLIFVGAWLQPQLDRELATAAALVAATLAFFLGRWVPMSPPDIENLVGDVGGPSRRPRFTMPLALMFTAALVTNILACWINFAHHLAGFLFWLMSLALFVVALWQRRSPPSDPEANTWTTSAGPQLARRPEAVALVLILVLAAALRMVLLQETPALIDPDEGRQGRHAERIWQDGFPNAFDLGWNVFPHLSYMAEYVWVQALGTSNVNLRLSAATVGVLSLIPAFFWVRRWWGNVIALFAVFLLAINHDHISFSRFALNNIQQVLVAGLMLAAFARLLRTRAWLDWTWFGYATGLGFHTYHAAKLFPLLLAATMAFFAVAIPRFVRRYVPGALIGLLAFLLFFSPVAVSTYLRWNQFYAGTSNRFDLYNLADAHRDGDITRVRNYISSHVIGCLRSFVDVPSRREATFDPFVAVPFLLGVGWMAWRWRDPRHLTLLIWAGGILVIGGMITDYPPWKPRLIGYLPAVCLIPAVVAGRVRGLLWRWSPGWADIIVWPLCLIWSGAALYFNWYTVFVQWPRVERGDPMTEMCRAMNHTPLPAAFYTAGGDYSEPKVATIDCMIPSDPDRVLIDLSDEPAIVPIDPMNRGTAVLFLTPDQRELVPLILHYYPHARYEVIHEPHYGNPMLHIFTLGPDLIEHSRGLHATFQSSTRTWSLPKGSGEFQPPADSDLPLRATWQGQLWIPEPGEYAFRSAGGTLHIDDADIRSDSPRGMAGGWHFVQLHAIFNAPEQRVKLEWRPPKSFDWVAIPKPFLHTHPEAHGLLGRYFSGAIVTDSAAPIAQEPDYTRIDSVVSFDWSRIHDEPPPAAFAASPSTMEWIGTVELPEGTSQTLRLDTNVAADVFINDALVLRSDPPSKKTTVDATITDLSGRVPILVRTVRTADDHRETWHLRLLWRGPGNEWTAFVKYRP